MKKNFLSVLSVILVIVLTTVVSLSVLAEGESSVAESSAVVESSDVSNVSNDSSDASASESNDSSATEGKDDSAVESKDESKKPVKDESKAENKDNTNKEDPTPMPSTFPWARVITLIVIVVLILVAFILSKTNTKLGLKINKFFKEYWSEIKKVSWLSPKETLKATGIVLVFIIAAAVAIGLLDFGFTKLVELLANIFTK